MSHNTSYCLMEVVTKAGLIVWLFQLPSFVLSSIVLLCLSLFCASLLPVWTVHYWLPLGFSLHTNALFIYRTLCNVTHFLFFYWTLTMQLPFLLVLLLRHTNMFPPIQMHASHKGIYENINKLHTYQTYKSYIPYIFIANVILW